MRIFFIGDIFASVGRGIVLENCQRIVTEEKVDLVIANGENSAGGFGINPNIADELFSVGVDVITTGNHVWDKREIYDYLARDSRVLRPANYAPDLPGRGLHIARARNGVSCAVLNLQGRVHMAPTDCPFRKADELLAGLDEAVRVRFVDFHAEATSEKMAMGWYLDGRVSAVVGTHTHIPTADTRILPKGTAYQTDCGMTGPYDSIIGVEKDAVLRKFLTSMPVRFEPAREMVELHGVLIDVEESSGRATAARRVEVRR
ncbi:MAG: TIGR00282 family metallophosphoesterase [Bryobacteraceae bacterium]|nr:TIGR00282 family metallophosphoesterase [Bryobacteraceae bacterium]